MTTETAFWVAYVAMNIMAIVHFVLDKTLDAIFYTVGGISILLLLILYVLQGH